MRRQPLSVASIVVVVVVASVALAGAPASAQETPPAQDGQARIHFESARLHFDRGDYEQALTEFQSAYDLSRRAGLLYNIALCHQSLGHHAAAADALERYLAEGEIEASERATLEARVQSLRRRAAEAGDPGAAPAPAAATAPQPGRRHLGFYAHLMLGASYVQAGTDTPFGRLKLTGGGSGNAISAGWAFWENVALHVDLWGAAMIGGTYELGGITHTDRSTRYDAGALGLGVTYWFMPLNLSISLAVGGAIASASQGEASTESDPGPAAALSVGKEWWLGDEWGLGVALSAFWLRTSETEARTDTRAEVTHGLEAWIVTVGASLTYN